MPKRVLVRSATGGGDRSAAAMWPGITQGLDSRCSCTRALMAGVYQVKVRDYLCVNLGGRLASALAGMARWPATYGEVG